MFAEFKKFLIRGNVLELAIAVIIGAAFSKVVTSLTADILMPILGMLMGKVNFSEFFISLNGVDYPTLSEAQKAGAPTINYGLFLNQVIDFLIVAASIFLLLKFLARAVRLDLLKQKEKK